MHAYDCAELLELCKLPGGGRGAVYEPSRNRQSHLWAFSERADAHSIALKRVFLRSAPLDTCPTVVSSSKLQDSTPVTGSRCVTGISIAV